LRVELELIYFINYITSIIYSWTCNLYNTWFSYTPLRSKKLTKTITGIAHPNESQFETKRTARVEAYQSPGKRTQCAVLAFPFVNLSTS